MTFVKCLTYYFVTLRGLHYSVFIEGYDNHKVILELNNEMKKFMLVWNPTKTIIIKKPIT